MRTAKTRFLASSLLTFGGIALVACSVASDDAVSNAGGGSSSGAAAQGDASSGGDTGVGTNPGSDGGDDAAPEPPEGPTVIPSPGAWTNVTSNLANMAADCGNLNLFAEGRGTGKIIAGVAKRGLWASSDGGGTWTRLGAGAGSDAIGNRPSWITYDKANPATYWESGIYGGFAQSGGVYKTTDSGNTFHRLGTFDHNDYVSVDYTDPNRQTLLAGGHEMAQTVYKSTNGGQSWTNIGSALPGGTGFSSNPLVIDAQTFVVNTYPSYSGGSPGIYRTTNGGTSWTKVSSEAANQPPLVASNGTLYWSAGNALLKSTDKGATWTKGGQGLRNETRPIELPDGRLAAVGSGKTLVLSSDGGSTWTPFGADLPYTPAGLIYSPSRKAFFIWRWDCGNIVLPNAIMKLE